jgi:GAF domain-containing protein
VLVDGGREQRLVRTLVALADTLVTGFDLGDFLDTLAERCVEVLDIAAAGLMLADPRGALRVVASSDERVHLLELFELQNEEGPCLDCWRTGEPVVNEVVGAQGGRWPRFGAEAHAAGFRSVHALPMRLREQTIGALNLFRDDLGALDEADVLAGQAMADVATIGILHERALLEARVLSEQLQAALNNRVIIEQAKGMLAAQANVDLGHAFRMMRFYARNNNLGLSEVARGVLEGLLPIQAVTLADRPPTK